MHGMREIDGGVLKGGICASCQEKIRRETMGEQAHASEKRRRELSRHGVAPGK